MGTCEAAGWPMAGRPHCTRSRGGWIGRLGWHDIAMPSVSRPENDRTGKTQSPRKGLDYDHSVCLITTHLVSRQYTGKTPRHIHARARW